MQISLHASFPKVLGQVRPLKGSGGNITHLLGSQEAFLSISIILFQIQFKLTDYASKRIFLGSQILRFCGPALPAYVAVALLLALKSQLSSVLRTGRVANMRDSVAKSVQLHKLEPPVLLLHLFLRRVPFLLIQLPSGLNCLLCHSFDL